MTNKQHYRGLTAREVEESRGLHGENVLTPAEREPVWMRFIRKFRDPLIMILLVAGALSIGISFYEYFGLHGGLKVFFEPVGIFAAIILATGLAFLFEYKADREFILLNQVNDEEPVQVWRDGKLRRIPKREVVVGDVVKVETGAEIPADGQLLECRTLMVDESSLTGEPVAEKSCGEAPSEPSTYPSDVLLRGTKVVEGYGIMRVTAVGDATENGKVFTAVQIDDSVRTPLDEQLDRLGRFVSLASYAVAALVVVGRLADYLLTEPFTVVGFIAYFLQTIMIAVTLIVVAVPEGLPMAVTLSLAYSMRRMLKTNNLVRKMHACETMGAATVICTDKTGTLTQNQMRVAEVFFLEQVLSSARLPEQVSSSARLPEQESSTFNFQSSIYENMAVNSTAELSENEVIGNPTEGALLLWLREQGVDYAMLREAATVVEQVPFNTERKYMSTTVRDSVEYVKGAPEIVMSRCELAPGERETCERVLTDWQSKAMRTLAFACNRKLQALVAISDPVRPEVPAAVRECLGAGIDVKIVTGDTMGTAMEIGRQIGLLTHAAQSSEVITGTELASLTDEELRERVQELKIIARARPMDKKRLVEALQAKGEIVAVTGDGTNDAPALRVAHVGLSMGDGTSVAKEASDITIIDNSFSSIGRAVMWGRSLYRNIQRFILFQLTVNVVACLIVLVGAFFDKQSPLTVTQMLWVNLIMDTFAAMALASLPPSERVMRERPRDRRKFIISTPMKLFIFGVGLAMTAVLLALYFYSEQSSGLSRDELSYFFTFFVMLQFWNLFNAKAFLTGNSAFRGLRQSKEFLFIASLVFFGQILIVEFGGEMFNVTRLSLIDWLTIISSTSVVLMIGELWRYIHSGR